MSQDPPVKTLTISEGVAVFTLNRAHVMNALNMQLREEIMEAARELDANPDVTAVVFTGAGDKAFCAGADLKERGRKTELELYDERRFFRSRWVNAVAGMAKPTIAAINGRRLKPWGSCCVS